MSGGYCALGIIENPADWSPFMIIGTPTFRNYFVAYDKANKRIGFSKFFVLFNYKLFLEESMRMMRGLNKNFLENDLGD